MSFLAIATLCRAQEGSIARSIITSLQSVAFYWLLENQRIFLIYLELFYCYPFRCFYSFHLSMVSSVMTLMQRLPGVQLLSRPSCSQSHCVINICFFFCFFFFFFFFFSYFFFFFFFFFYLFLFSFFFSFFSLFFVLFSFLFFFV